MNIKRLIIVCSIAVACLASTGCISFEEEIFLNADGGGEFVIQISLPDLPDSIAKSSPGGSQEEGPQEQMAKFKSKLTSGLPAGVSVDQVKEVRENGVIAFYAVFRFKNIRDLEPVLANLGKSADADKKITDKSQWSMAINKEGAKNVFTSSIYFPIADDASQKPDAGTDASTGSASGQPAKSGDSGLDKQLQTLMLGMIRMRVVLHTPTKISDSNADIVLHDNVAIWNSSMIAFVNRKKPIELKAVY